MLAKSNKFFTESNMLVKSMSWVCSDLINSNFMIAYIHVANNQSDYPKLRSWMSSRWRKIQRLDLGSGAIRESKCSSMKKLD